MTGTPSTTGHRTLREEWAHFSVTQLCDVCCPSITNGNRRRDDNPTVSPSQGTAVHRAIESVLRGETPPTEHAAVCAHATAFGTLIGGTVTAVEEPLVTPELELIGIPDALFQMEDGSIAVVDWKHSADIATDATTRMEYPFDRLPRCALARYALQVSLYGRLLERFHQRQVSALFVCNVRTGRSYDLPYLRLEADFLIDVAIGVVHCRRSDFPLCEIENKTAIRPVLCRDGLIRSRLCALQRDLPYVENAYLRTCAWGALQTAIGWEARVRSLARNRRRHVWKMPPGGVSTPAAWFSNWEPCFF
jgi:hypothetical protein